MTASLVGSLALLVLALAHSVLGEQGILRPLFAAEWTVGLPRWAVERILRFAWHLTSLAWVALAAAWMGVSLPLTAAGLGLLSAVIVFVMLRGHLAWPLFALVGFAGLSLEGLLAPVVGLGALSGIGVMLAAAGLHVYWALGGRWGLAGAIPQKDGAPAFQPGPLLTLAVAAALLGFAGLVGWVWLGAAPGWARVLVGLGSAVMAARAVGDGRQVGFSKSNRGTLFARRDDAIYTPLVVLLSFASAGVLLG